MQSSSESMSTTAWFLDLSTEPKTSEASQEIDVILDSYVDVTSSCPVDAYVWERRVCVCVWMMDSSLSLGCCWDNRWLSGVSSLFFPWCPRLTSLRFSSWSFSEPGSGVQSGGAAHGQLRAGRTATHGHPAGRWDAATILLRSPLQHLTSFF